MRFYDVTFFNDAKKPIHLDISEHPERDWPLTLKITSDEKYGVTIFTQREKLEEMRRQLAEFLERDKQLCD